MSSANSAEAPAGASATAIADRLPLDAIADALTTDGWWVGDDAIPRSLTDRLRAEIERLDEEDRLKRAGIGRETDFQLGWESGHPSTGGNPDTHQEPPGFLPDVL